MKEITLDDHHRLLEGLLSSLTRGSGDEAPRHIETHISSVILSGDFAYKIKKPVNFGFLDFTTLDRRRHFCGEEIRLNSRLAPQIYLDVVPISGARRLLRRISSLQKKRRRSRVVKSRKPKFTGFLIL